MQEASEEYRGYKIVVAPIKDCEDMWDFEYRISALAGGAESRRRAQTVGGHLTPEIACRAGIEVARTEVDNLLALENSKAP
jgi:hypothetical protein